MNMSNMDPNMMMCMMQMMMNCNSGNNMGMNNMGMNNMGMNNMGMNNMGMNNMGMNNAMMSMFQMMNGNMQNNIGMNNIQTGNMNMQSMPKANNNVVNNSFGGINLVFRQKNGGRKIIVQANKEESVDEVIKKYRVKSGDNDESIFIFNGKELNTNPKLKLNDANIQNNSEILVISLVDIKGA